jgi:hypothetical protein
MVSKPYVVSAFSLDTSASKRAVRDKVEQLLDEARYIYNVSRVQSLLYVTILILGPTRVEPRGENRNIPCAGHTNARQQDLVPREKR